MAWREDVEVETVFVGGVAQTGSEKAKAGSLKLHTHPSAFDITVYFSDFGSNRQQWTYFGCILNAMFVLRIFRRPPASISQRRGSISHAKPLSYPSFELGPLILCIAEIHHRR